MRRAWRQRDEPGIQLPEEYLALAQTQTTTHPATADKGALRRQARAVLPQGGTSLHADGKHVILASDDIHHALMYQRLGLVVVAEVQRGTERGTPDTLHILHGIAVDLVQWREALVLVAAAISQPAGVVWRI